MLSYSRILVPLDGSGLAEAVLPAACSLAQRLHASLVLLHVLERGPPDTVHGEPHQTTAPGALAYLERRADELRRLGITVEIHVHERRVGDVAAAIDRHAHEHSADLIAMCAHGRTNLRTRLVGSIAERILRGGSIPILLRTVRRPERVRFELRSLLVPLDFNHDVEAAVSAVRVLAPAYGAAVVLLSSVEPGSPPSSPLLPGASAVTREFEREELIVRVGELAERLRSEFADVRAFVDDRSPTDAILGAADAVPADLIVLVTDAHGRLSRWYGPSTAQQLLGHPDLTLLLIKEL